MNKLYGLLTYSLESSQRDGYYAKMYIPVKHTWRSQQLVDDLVKFVPPEKLQMFACFVCWGVTLTPFGQDILTLDPVNTYNEFSRPAAASPDDPAYLLCGLCGTASDMARICTTLDKDIMERLVVPVWMESAAAICLQILRETC